MRNILIMVLSYDMPPYDALMKAQQETWDDAKERGVITMYYMGGNEHIVRRIYPHVRSYSMQYNCSDAYFEMHYKFKLCLQECMQIMPTPFTIFRTNSSSYVNKAKLRELIETLPEEKLYYGWSLGEKEAVSGAGIIMSYDVCKILADELPEGENIEEDILIGRILKKHDIEITDDKSRFDVTDPNEAPLDRWHYRFKTDDRMKDCENMRRLRERIKQQV